MYNVNCYDSLLTTETKPLILGFKTCWSQWMWIFFLLFLYWSPPMRGRLKHSVVPQETTVTFLHCWVLFYSLLLFTLNPTSQTFPTKATPTAFTQWSNERWKMWNISGFTNPDLVPGLLTENPETVTKRHHELPYIEKNSGWSYK